MDLKDEQRRVYVALVWASVVCLAVLAASYVVIPQVVTLPTDLAERIAFALRADVPVLACVLVAMRMVSGARLRSVGDIRGSAFGPPSPAISIKVAFLQNTLEQAFMAVGTHLALATLLPSAALGLLPGAVLLFVVGRIFFYCGYPRGARGRAFGMIMTVLPTLLGLLASIALLIVGAFGAGLAQK